MRRALAPLAALLVATSAAAREPVVLTTLGGDPVSLARASSERALIVHFWATWCADCAEELSVVARVARACGAQGVSVRIAAAGDSAAAVAAFQRAHGLAFDALLDPSGRAWREAGAFGLPANWLRTPAGDRLLTGPRTPEQWQGLASELGCDFAPPSASEHAVR
jgi:thiol-disulfide isomerase/thioredoxin